MSLSSTRGGSILGPLLDPLLGTLDLGVGNLVATPSFSAALVTVALGLPLLGDAAGIPVALGPPLILLEDTPLQTTIAVGAGSMSDGPNGSKIAVADGVSLQLLQGLTPEGAADWTWLTPKRLAAASPPSSPCRRRRSPFYATYRSWPAPAAPRRGCR